MKTEIEGTLVSAERLNQEARKRKSKQEVILVPKPLEATKFHGYEQIGETKTKIRLARDLEPWKVFENRIWLLLYSFGFTDLNVSRLFVNTHIPSSPDDTSSRLEVDVLGKADDNVFVIECRTRETLGMKRLRDVITEFGHFRSRVEGAIRKYYNDDEKRIKVSFIIATQNIEVSDADRKEAHRSGMHVWDESHIAYLEQIAKLRRLIGDAARYQLYAVMFGNQEIKALEEEEPAILGKIGKRKYFSFLTTPEKLLRIAYVHHRAGSFEIESLKQIPVTYQRLLKEKKLQEIKEFIEDRYFPNSIIVNFEREPRFDQASRKQSKSDTQFGFLHLPNRYRSAWVIDGQHRLYGYAKSDRRFTTKIPVVAFVGLQTSEQAKLFVEINENQTPVEKNLLWDLYSDIYAGSDDPKQIEDFTISNVAKRLNQLDGALKGHVYIPSIISKRSATANITMTTLCENIKKNALLSEKMLGNAALGQADREKFIADRIGVFFDVIQETYPEDWNRGEKGFLRSNNGIAALLIVLRQILKYFNARDEEEVYRGKNIGEYKKRLKELLAPIGEYLKADMAIPDELRKKRGSAGQSESAADLCRQINQQFKDFRLPPTQPKPLPKDSRQVSEEDVKKQVENIEKYLRRFVFEKLNELHGNKWYELGVPGDISEPNSPKGTIEKLLNEELSNNPYREEEFQSHPELKLDFTFLGHLSQIIIAKQNRKVFEHTFRSPQRVQQQFGHLITLRNALQHFRSIDRVDWENGRTAIMWISKCLKIWREESE